MNKTEEEFLLKADDTGSLQIKKETKTNFTKNFSTPNSDGVQFETLFKDLENGDEISVRFLDVRICKHCGRPLQKNKNKK